MHKYIISGGPGAGKTTLLQALHQKGYNVSEEASRQLIIEEIAKGSDCLPWGNLPCFARKVLERMIQDFGHAHTTSRTTFFDRGIPDIISYLKVAAQPVDEVYEQAMQQNRYSPLVFLAPPWQDIYVNDSERWQTFEEAVILFHAIKETYQSLRYTIVELPKASVAERVNFVISHI
ncbi:AAA family ATPase [Pontibacter silvestris]|uniref:AAA family ATPase n=1 Tax=Pontibacter silvestris TaxID=2305183 RepID=A0ABW4X1J8_9BACT|nr:AAA family ATPase [Pontibacter silvestris]MCC9138216.1 AAA family ATPase [Pontibacter silvestris]